MNRRVTMTDVAKRAGVHYTTVSLALRNHPSLPVATRERLRALAEEMGYRPDPVLHALIDYRGKLKPRRNITTLAYVTNWDSRWGWKQAWPHPEFFGGAEQRATDLGYQLEHFWLGEPGLTHQRLSDVLHTRGITGLIIASHRYEIDRALRFKWQNFSAVKIDFFPHEPALHAVTNDQRAVIRLAVRRVLAAGYRRIGFVMHRLWDHGVDLAWSAGFLGEQQTIPPAERIPIFKFPDSLPLDTSTHLDHLAPRAPFEAWLRRHRPDVLISTAAFVQPHLEALGISVPRDLGFADILLDRFEGQTAGVRQNCRRVGELAVEILAGQLQQHAFGVPQFPTATLVEGTWFDGASLPRRSPAKAAASTATPG
ncbi:MAG TPA: LacI family DNA-binding transcriptional regulator [Opitutus sp.]|nr:LacI family DNA-binding transcriptional regulator [Opitutus sp.]